MNNIQITTKIWGPMCWVLLHSISINYDDKYKDKYFYLLRKLKFIIPCYDCIIHLKMFINENGIDQNSMSKKYLTEWLINLHNSVNIKLGKKKISIKDALKIIHKKDYLNNKNIITFLIILNYFYLNDSLSFFHFQKIKTFYKLLGDIYPDKKVRIKFKELVTSQDFIDTHTESELNMYFRKNFNKLL